MAQTQITNSSWEGYSWQILAGRSNDPFDKRHDNYFTKFHKNLQFCNGLDVCSNPVSSENFIASVQVQFWNVHVQNVH